jgi:hypothetical protein
VRKTILFFVFQKLFRKKMEGSHLASGDHSLPSNSNNDDDTSSLPRCWSELPEVILALIVSFLESPKEVIVLERTCSTFRRLLISSSAVKKEWKRFVIDRWGDIPFLRSLLEGISILEPLPTGELPFLLSSPPSFSPTLSSAPLPSFLHKLPNFFPFSNRSLLLRRRKG